MSAKILVADDTRTERFFIDQLLQRLGIHADLVDGGKEALKQTLQKKYDLILLDCAMPEPDGGKTCSRLRQNPDNPNCRTPVFYMGEVPEDFPACSGHLEKPVRLAALSNLLASHLPDAANDGGVPHWLRAEVPELNVDAGITHCGSEDGYLAAIDIFYDTISAKADEIEGYYDSGDIESYTIKVHALKSSARIIGADALSDAALVLEMAGKEGDVETIREKTAALLSNYRAFRPKLARLHGDVIVADGLEDNATNDAPALPPVDPGILSDAYTSIAEFAGAMDFDLTKMVLTSLEGYALPEEDRKRVEMIQAKLLNLDWDGIKEISSKVH